MSRFYGLPETDYKTPMPECKPPRKEAKQKYYRMDSCPKDRPVILACPTTISVSCCLKEAVGLWVRFPFKRWKQQGGILHGWTLYPIGWRENPITYWEGGGSEK